MDKILTINKIGTSRIVEKKSIFIGHAAPVKEEKEALDFIDGIRTRFPDARHHAFAYQIGENNEIQRASDGGEPGGTAGRPILEMIKQENLKDIVVVVTRYFGGILLGTGGLVRAYGKAGHLAMIDGEIVEKIYGQEVFITIDYHLLGKVQNYLVSEKVMIKNVAYSDKVQVHFLTVFDQVSQTSQGLQDLSNGMAQINLGEAGYFTGIKE